MGHGDLDISKFNYTSVVVFAEQRNGETYWVSLCIVININTTSSLVLSTLQRPDALIHERSSLGHYWSLLKPPFLGPMIHSWEVLPSQQITSTWLSNWLTNTAVAQPKFQHANTKYRPLGTTLSRNYQLVFATTYFHVMILYVLLTACLLLGLPTGRFHL
jgi:hypothetical protein